MTRYHGKDTVKGGLYWNPTRWQILTIAEEGGMLPGEAETRYVRVPALMMLVLGPIMGGLYVMFLPFIGFAMVLGVAGAKLLAMAHMTGYHAEDTVKGGLYWSPGRWQIVAVPKEGGVLPGEAPARYIRVPAVLMLVLGPIMGGLLVVFLPLIGFAMLLGFGGAKLVAMARKGVRPLAHQKATR